MYAHHHLCQSLPLVPECPGWHGCQTEYWTYPAGRQTGYWSYPFGKRRCQTGYWSYLRYWTIYVTFDFVLKTNNVTFVLALTTDNVTFDFVLTAESADQLLHLSQGKLSC